MACLLESVSTFLPVLRSSFQRCFLACVVYAEQSSFHSYSRFCELEGDELPSVTCLKVELIGLATCERGTS